MTKLDKEMDNINGVLNKAVTDKFHEIEIKYLVY